MEKLILPAFRYEMSLKVFTFIVVPRGVLPMDIYNTLENLDVDPNYGWLTSRGRYLSPNDAAEFALRNGLLDRLVTHLDITLFKGEWA